MYYYLQASFRNAAVAHCVYQVRVDAGVRGVINALTGAGSVIGPLIKNPKVRKVAFTGSTAVGKQVLADSVDT